MGDAADPRDGRRTFIVPAIKPFDHYDFSRAKIACNLAWLVAKAFGTGRRWPPRASLPRSCAHPGFVSVLWSPPLAWLGALARGRDGRCEEEKGGG